MRSLSNSTAVNSQGKKLKNKQETRPMSEKILQINFKFDMPLAEYDQLAAQTAEPIAATPGLRWKVWLMNEAEHECGGIYLFDDEASVRAFLAGPIVTGAKSDPTLSDASVKIFDVMEEHTAITRGPIG